MIVPEIIDNQETLVRFIFESHFKNKKIEISRINTGEVFLDSRNLGVSLQRHLFCDENLCKKLALNVPNQKYVGFMLFKKEMFLEVRKEHLKVRNEFEADILFTPLDENDHVIEDKTNILIDTPKNSSHSDLFYLNPATIEDESPNTAIRLFSRQLCKVSKLFIDNENTEEHCSLVFV